MRACLAGLLALAGAGVAGAALAQTGTAIAVPPPPPIVAEPSSPPTTSVPLQATPPGLVQTPMPPANSDTGSPATDNGSPAPGSPAPGSPAPGGPPPATSMPMSNDWVSGKTAEIGVLDRVDGGIANLTIPVGGQVTSGDLTISVLACVMRPANEVPDAAIFLNVQSSADAAGPPLFHGWMVRSIPAASVVGDQSETLRVANCT